MHPAYTFVERLIELQNRRRGRSEGRLRDKERTVAVSFYHSDVAGLLRHPYLAGAASGSASGAGSSAGAPPVPTDFVYIGAARLRTSPLFELIFAAPEGWRALSDWLVEVISEVAMLPSESDGGGRRTGVFALIAEHIRRLANSLEGCGVELSTKTYAALLRRSLQSVTVPFEGEPLEGVQVMGILETRALDFENVIFLSAGDSNMPGSLVGAPSFIPYNLKAAYGLPTPEHHEGVWAYHFFRLISRARRVDAVWSRTTDDRSTGAPSRYLLQLDYESPHTVAKETVTVDVNLSPVEPIVVEKSAEVMARLGEFLRADAGAGDGPGSGDGDGDGDGSDDGSGAGSGDRNGAGSGDCAPPAKPRRRLSPSLFFTYTECPLKFYFRGVARLRPEEEVAEEVDGALLGNILHRAMQSLYAPLVGTGDPRDRIRALVRSPLVEEAVRAAVTELYPWEDGAGPEDWGGAIVLAHRTVADYINRCVLPYDASLPGAFAIEGLEKEVAAEVAFASGTVVFGGIADRIDRLAGGALRVVDYKTGNPRNNASALLQMGLYAMMLGSGGGCGDGDRGGSGDGGDGGAQKVEAALYYVRDMARPDYSPPPVPQGADFEDTLRATLATLFDPAVPFAQTPDPKPCEWCDFRTICRR
jgi:RecB family exonuclease